MISSDEKGLGYESVMNRYRDLKDINRIHDLLESLMVQAEDGKVFDDLTDEFDGYKLKDILELEKRLEADIVRRSLVFSWLGMWKEELNDSEANQ